MEFDWGVGHYETTGAQLVLAAERTVSAADVRAGDRVLDLGCGTGNAALRAAALGARVVGVDPSVRLLQVAAQEAATQGLDIGFIEGKAEVIPAPDEAFDVVLGVFSIMFAQDPEAAAADIARVLAPGGRVVMTSWLPVGGLHEAVQQLFPEPPPPSPWQSQEGVAGLFEAWGSTAIGEQALAFESDSAESYFRELEERHPVWIAIRKHRQSDWTEVRERCIRVLHEANESVDGFCITSRYLLTVATKVI